MFHLGATDDLTEFCELRDRHFLAKREWVIARHATDRGRYDLWRSSLVETETEVRPESGRDPVS